MALRSDWSGECWDVYKGIVEDEVPQHKIDIWRKGCSSMMKQQKPHLGTFQENFKHRNCCTIITKSTW